MGVFLWGDLDQEQWSKNTDHGVSQEPMNPWPEWSHRFHRCTIFRVTLDHWSCSRTSQRKTRYVSSTNEPKIGLIYSSFFLSAITLDILCTATFFLIPTLLVQYVAIHPRPVTGLSLCLPQCLNRDVPSLYFWFSAKSLPVVLFCVRLRVPASV